MEINLFKYLNAARTVNIIKVFTSFVISRFLDNPVVWGMPVSFSIEPTNYCNLRCPECPSGLGTLTRPLGFLDIENFKKFVDQVYRQSFYMQLYFQGEPFLHKDLLEMISYAQSRNVYISISTNGHFISGKNIEELFNNPPDKIIFSLDGLDEKSYQAYRIGGSFAKAESALRLLVQAKKKSNKKKPFIELQFLVMKQNEHFAEEVIEYGEKLGVDKITLKTMQVTSYENAINFLPENKKYRRYTLTENKFKIKSSLSNHCFLLWKTSVITWDGKVVPCCFDKDAQFQLGNVFDKEFKYIWKSVHYKEFRKKILTGRKNVEMCTNCTSGIKPNILSTEY
ncbi:MAG: radical SAM/SPASM domain-containing protein [Ignavibacteria bacterium]